VFAHSHFIENPPIGLEAMDPSFLRWFYHILLDSTQQFCDFAIPLVRLNYSELSHYVSHFATVNLAILGLCQPFLLW
jgi:hypothetical protein